MVRFAQVIVVFAGIATAALLAPAPAAAQAQSPAKTNVAKQVQDRIDRVAKKVQAACKTDIQRRCKNVTPGEGRILYCILAYGDKLTPTCAGTMIEVGRDVSMAMNDAARTADACYDDIEKLCPNVPEGEGRIAQCLIDNKPKLASACAGELDKLQARVKKK
ncbi:MAG: cysteine rich repeat-containing protein [Xanthobacteraceae bacterium]|uniref:cysteine rich repeat-containing protein n=1 Tax=Pseudolabrys sp. TaxID=1960880 RepID=UPI003D0C967A